MKRYVLSLAVFGALALASVPVPCDPPSRAIPLPMGASPVFDVDPTQSTVTFRIRREGEPSEGSFERFTGHVSGDLKKSKLDVISLLIDSASVTTGNAERDDLLKSPALLDVEEHQRIRFRTDTIRHIEDKKYEISGKLDLHGVRRKVTLAMTFSGIRKNSEGSDTARIEIRGTLKRRDWGLDWNRTLEDGSKLLADTVEVEIVLLLNRRMKDKVFEP